MYNCSRSVHIAQKKRSLSVDEEVKFGEKIFAKSTDTFNFLYQQHADFILSSEEFYYYKDRFSHDAASWRFTIVT